MYIVLSHPMILNDFDFMDGFLSLKDYVGGTLSYYAVLLRGGVAELGPRSSGIGTSSFTK
jgi:hypothetical protein